MPIVKQSGRQEVIAAFSQVIDWDDIVDAQVDAAIELPQNAIVVAGHVNVIMAFDSVTSDSLDVGEDITPDPNAYTASVINLQSAGVVALDLNHFKFTTQGNLTVEVNSVGGGLSAGSFQMIVQYVVDGRAAFNQG